MAGPSTSASLSDHHQSVGQGCSFPGGLAGEGTTATLARLWAGFNSLRAPLNSWLAIGQELPSVPCRMHFSTEWHSWSKSRKPVESASKTEDAVLCNIVTAAESHHLRQVRSQSQALTRFKGRSLHREWTPGSSDHQEPLENLLPRLCRDSYTNVHSNFKIVCSWKQLRCPLTDKWINTLCEYTMQYYSIMKGNGL